MADTQNRYVDQRRWTPAHQAAHDALVNLILHTSEDEALRVVAGACGPAIRTTHLLLRGLKESGGRPCVMRLLGKRCTTESEHLCLPPATDHPAMLTKDGKPSVLVSQPYGLGFTELKELVSFCETFGLEVEIDACGWYFFGRALRVEIAKPGNGATHLTVADCAHSATVDADTLSEAIRKEYERRGRGRDSHP